MSALERPHSFRPHWIGHRYRRATFARANNRTSVPKIAISSAQKSDMGGQKGPIFVRTGIGPI